MCGCGCVYGCRSEWCVGMVCVCGAGVSGVCACGCGVVWCVCMCLCVCVEGGRGQRRYLLFLFKSFLYRAAACNSFAVVNQRESIKLYFNKHACIHTSIHTLRSAISFSTLYESNKILI